MRLWGMDPRGDVVFASLGGTCVCSLVDAGFGNRVLILGAGIVALFLLNWLLGILSLLVELRGSLSMVATVHSDSTTFVRSFPHGIHIS